jgi:hypothetical protein
MMAQLSRAAAIAEQKVLSQDDPVTGWYRELCNRSEIGESCPADPTRFVRPSSRAAIQRAEARNITGCW